MSDTSQIKTLTGRVKTKKRDRSASEERLLKASEEIFSKFGFKGATTRMIAKKADVNESLIGRYFDGKMGLLFALIEKHVDTFHSEDLPYPAQGTLTAELTKFIDFKFDTHCKKNEDFFKIVLSQMLTDVKFLKRMREILPMFQEPALQVRLVALQNSGKMKKTVNLQDMIRELDLYFHGTMLFEVLIAGKNEKEVEQDLKKFVTHYAHAYET
jgi:AcrR family transcriptional regulator